MGSIPNDDTMTCVEINQYSLENLILKGEFENNYQLNVDIYLAKSANNTIFKIISSEFTNYFYNSSTNDSWKYEQYMPLFDFDECISLLVEAYNYSKNEIHIGIFQNNDLKKNNPNVVLLSAINSTSYKIFLSNGTNINFSLCNFMDIKVEKPINTSLIWNFGESIDLLNKYNLSIFDQNNEMFDDICIPLEIDGKDLSIFTRQNRIKSKLNICDKGCDFLGVNYEKNYSICKCKINNEEESQMDMKDFINQNFEIINKTTQSNIKILKCLPKTKFDKNNYIFYISLILFIGNGVASFLIIFFYFIKRKIEKENDIENKETANNNNTEEDEGNKNSHRNIFSVINDLTNNSAVNNKNNKSFVYNDKGTDEEISQKSDVLRLNVNITSKYSKKNILSKSVPIVLKKIITIIKMMLIIIMMVTKQY